MKKIPDEKILTAFDKSEEKSVLDICRIAQISSFTFYRKMRSDPAFKKKLLIKQREHIDKQIAEIA